MKAARLLLRQQKGAAKDRLEAELNLRRVPEDQRRDLASLLALVQSALLPFPPDGDSGFPADIGILDDPSFQERQSARVDRIKRFCREARELLESDDHDNIDLTQHAFSEGIAPINAEPEAIQCSHDEALAMVAEARRGIEFLASLRFPPKRKGRISEPSPLSEVARAVCIWRTEQGLDVQFEFQSVEPANGTRGGRVRKGAAEAAPDSWTTLIISSVLAAWGFPAPKAEIRTALRAYRKEISGRGPIRPDLLASQLGLLDPERK